MSKIANRNVGRIEANDEIDGVYACLQGVFIVGKHFDGSRDAMRTLREALSAWVVREYAHALRSGEQ